MQSCWCESGTSGIWRDGLPAGFTLAPAASVTQSAPPASWPLLGVDQADTTDFVRGPSCDAANCVAGWTIAAGPDGTPVLLTTVDGGAAWRAIHPMGLDLAGPWRQPPELDFVQGGTGRCLTFPLGATAADLYRTLDGGHDWVRVLAVTQAPSGRITAQPGAAPPAGMPTGIVAPRLRHAARATGRAGSRAPVDPQRRPAPGQ